MKKIDHLYLGRYLADIYLKDKPDIYRDAFLWGNILPDINLFTYFRGSIKHKNVKGHNYESASKYMKRLTRWLGQATHYGVRYYIRLGMLMHYTADAFTYTHNRCFNGTLKEHVAYENAFHNMFPKYLENLPQEKKNEYPRSTTFSNLVDTIVRLHDNYVLNAGHFLWDAENIVQAARITMSIPAEACTIYLITKILYRVYPVTLVITTFSYKYRNSYCTVG